MVGEKSISEKPLVSRVSPGEKAPNRDLPPKSGVITCITVAHLKDGTNINKEKIIFFYLVDSSSPTSTPYFLHIVYLIFNIFQQRKRTG